MTREEEMIKEHECAMNERIPENIRGLMVSAMKWADFHPINQWHKVEDELPPRIKETVNVSRAVLVTDGTSYGVSYYNYALNAWRSVYFITITHWMPLSELP